MLTTQEFIAEISGPIAVYGTDGGGIATDIYLKRLGLREQVVCFLDAIPKQAAFCGKPVMSLAYLAGKPDIAVVTACLNLTEIAALLHTRNLGNNLYYHASFWPFMDDEQPLLDTGLANLYYNPDSQTSFTLLKTLFALRYDPAVSRIQPWRTGQEILYAPSTYWYGVNALPPAPLTIIDAGAFDGDTLQSLVQTYGEQIRRYHAFEPIPEFFARLQKQAVKHTNKLAIHCHNLALYDKNTMLAFLTGVPKSSRLSVKGKIPVLCRRLDDLDLTIDGQACLKMDVEGLELESLVGAAEFIRTRRPRLAVCVYHKTNDIFKIPAFIQSLAPDYRFTLAGGVHTVCYGACPA